MQPTSMTAAKTSLLTRILNKILFREKHVCPWWLCFAFDNSFRKFVQDPEKILTPYVSEGNTVLDIGCGMGYFTIPLARMVGEKGRVIAVDIQKQMLSSLQRRAKRAGLQKRIVLQGIGLDSLRLDKTVDFAMAFCMINEVPDRVLFLEQIKSTLKPGALFLIAEPSIHVSKEMYESTVRTAREVGFALRENLHIFFSRSALFSNPSSK